MNNEILNEVKKFIDYKSVQKVQSFVIFDLSEKDNSVLKHSLFNEFQELHNYFSKEREKELGQMLKKIDWVYEKYSNLADRYEGKPVLNEILEWENEVHKHEYDKIASEETKLKYLDKNFILENIDFNKFYENEKVFDKLNDKIDFYNLQRCNYDEEFARHYKLTEDELKYRKLQDYFYKKSSPKYVYCYNEKYSGFFDDWFRAGFKWNRLKWSVFAFEISQKEFEEKASKFVKEEMYLNRTVINNATQQ
ncbi:hypothetical protein [Tenacibaculum amylolyticum]|uniref:hypothetical protein n=1 Tax=Tenacibaculum amylolyticum TaxID=104269 RepID=UPI0038963BF4